MDNSYISFKLNDHWVAVECPDGSLLIQHTSNVLNSKDGHVKSAHEFSLDSQVDSSSLVVRTVKLTSDGDVIADDRGISPSGVPTKDSFPVFPPIMDSFVTFMKNIFQKKQY
jgi:hypothetical protein